MRGFQTTTKKLLVLTAAVALMLGVAGCSQKEFPNKQISLIIQAAPGGESDMTGRMIAQQMQQDLKVPVVASNKTGAAGAVAFQYVAAQKADGYTIGICPAEVAMVNALGISKIKPADLEFLGQAAETPSAVIVRGNAPYNNLQEFIEYAKNNPGKVRNGTSGAGSTMHIGGETLARAAGIDFNYVPFDGSAPAVTALMGGHVEVVTIGVLAAAVGVDSGDLKILAILGDERSKRYPNVATAKEQGINAIYTTWVGLYAPKGLPADVKKKLEAAVKAGVAGAPYKEFTDAKGLQIKYRNAVEFTKFAEENFQMYSELIPQLGIGKK